MYELGPAVKQSQDGWSEYDIDVEFKDVPGPLLARRHRLWLGSSLSKDATLDEIEELDKIIIRNFVEITQAHRYVGMMLTRFQDDLKTCWLSLRKNKASNAKRLGEFHAMSRGLKVVPVFALQVIGRIADDMPAWWIVESNEDVNSKQCYVKENNFNVTQSESEPWTELIDALIHKTYHLSQGKTLIVQMHCNDLGQLSNILCVTKQAEKYIGASAIGHEAMKMAFSRFQTEHKCNDLCDELNLPALEN